jgi:2-keto-3-deoxy-L-rhamnonate aldolase RhmA
VTPPDADARPWDEGRVALGGWIGSKDCGELAVQGLTLGGMEHIGVDCQHSAIGEDEAAQFVEQVDGAVPVIFRVSAKYSPLIGQVLDAGADGFIVPLVNTREEAEAIVRAYRYPPHGARSFGPFGAGLPLDTAALEARVSCFAMVETAEGLENVAAICSTPGITGVYVGPVDLGISLGIADPLSETPPDDLIEALQRIVVACTDAGRVPGIWTRNTEWAVRAVDLGFRMVTLGRQPAQLLGDGARAAQEAVRRQIQTAL